MSGLLGEGATESWVFLTCCPNRVWLWERSCIERLRTPLPSFQTLTMSGYLLAFCSEGFWIHPSLPSEVVGRVGRGGFKFLESHLS